MTILSNLFVRASLAPLTGVWGGGAAGAVATDTTASAASSGVPTGAVIHEVANGRSIDLGFTTIDLSHLSVSPIHVLGVTIDLSVTKHVVYLVIATILTIITMWIAARQAERLEGGREAPTGLLNMFEAFYLFLRDDVVMASIGEGGERFVPFVETLFFFILFANLLGLVPWGASATANISVTGALAVVSMFVIEISGYLALGTRGYLKTIFAIPEGLNPVMTVVMFIVMPPIEIISKFTRIFALAMRLFANMLSGHLGIAVLLTLILTYGGLHLIGIAASIGALSLSLFVMLIEIFVAFLQAYIFAALTAVFIGLMRYEH